MTKTFSYFAYGSNLLTDRIKLNNPSAKLKTIGRVSDYALAFDYYSRRWQGAAATIVPSEGSEVWGVVWELSEHDKRTLDKQEGVGSGIYRPIEVSVKTKEDFILPCRAYQLIALEEQDKRPSKVYKDVIIRGAEEHGLPHDYIEKLRMIEDNGYDGPVTIKLPLA
ncbi:unnamed protein product [Darwinula stevensoni]|uniref:gamma-glutamylcyclotransferase n=1 Tax=Darwinula stevensoni TaxID=69355 RepID=A0A7R8ZXQ7_9CRUS|nr:unnamed protein product [Darwinula stevensoni]CAG0878929.1 unnamed protein product [Darwinula stevensoni]